jgi:hypothetical protein
MQPNSPDVTHFLPRGQWNEINCVPSCVRLTSSVTEFEHKKSATHTGLSRIVDLLRNMWRQTKRAVNNFNHALDGYRLLVFVLFGPYAPDPKVLICVGDVDPLYSFTGREYHVTRTVLDTEIVSYCLDAL